MLSLKNLHVWGYPAEAMPYRPNEKKLDLRTVSCYFVGYSERSWGYNFFDPKTKYILESRNAQFFEDVEFTEGDTVRDFVFLKRNMLIFLRVLLDWVRIVPSLV